MAIVSVAAPCPPGFKPEWRDILEEHVSIYRRLPEPLTLEVERLIPWFINHIQWEGKAGEVVTEIKQVCVASEACLLIARRSIDDYSHMKRVEFFPENLEAVGMPNVLGDASPSGIVRLGWYWVEEGMKEGEDNKNLTIHEFAHILDYRDGRWDSIPQFRESGAEEDFRRFIREEYRDILGDWQKKTNIRIVREYATTEKCEFLTCATESFLERANTLKFLRPKLYQWLKKIYGMDPATWPRRVSHRDLISGRTRQLGWQPPKQLWSEQVLPAWEGFAGIDTNENY